MTLPLQCDSSLDHAAGCQALGLDSDYLAAILVLFLAVHHVSLFNLAALGKCRVQFTVPSHSRCQCLFSFFSAWGFFKLR